MSLSEITSALRAFIHQRPGFEPGNYAGAPGAYRADYRKCLRDRDDALAMLAYVERASDAENMERHLRDALSSGRLVMLDDGTLEYTTGQYWPTEYRNAACRVLARALWHYLAGNSADAGSVRRQARLLYGRRIASRWFA